MISGLLLAWLLSRIKIPKTKEAMLLVGEKNQKKE